MKKRNRIELTQFLVQQYKKLEKSETKTRRKLNKIYTIFNARLRRIIEDTVNYCIDNNLTNYSKLFQRISQNESIELSYQMAQVKSQIRPELYETDFPFNVMSFDRLNRMEYTRACIIMNQMQLAIEEYEILKDHIVDYCDDLLIRLEEWLDIYDEQAIAAILAVIVVDKKYPIDESLYRNNLNIAKQVADRLEKSIIRSEKGQKSAKIITEYAQKMDRGSTENILFTQGTRATIQAVGEYVKPYVTHFYSVTMGDDKVCKNCSDIALIQLYRPVEIELLSPGTNAPPFHPFCRCGIEVIKNDGS